MLYWIELNLQWLFLWNWFTAHNGTAALVNCVHFQLPVIFHFHHDLRTDTVKWNWFKIRMLQVKSNCVPCVSPLWYTSYWILLSSLKPDYLSLLLLALIGVNLSGAMVATVVESTCLVLCQSHMSRAPITNISFVIVILSPEVLLRPGRIC